MASSIAFDTHAFVKCMKEVGMPEPQVEVLAQSQIELIEERLATKRDLKELEVSLKRDVKELELRMTLKLGSMMILAVGVVAILVRLL